MGKLNESRYLTFININLRCKSLGLSAFLSKESAQVLYITRVDTESWIATTPLKLTQYSLGEFQPKNEVYWTGNQHSIAVKIVPWSYNEDDQDYRSGMVKVIDGVEDKYKTLLKSKSDKSFEKSVMLFMSSIQYPFLAELKSKAIVR